MTEDGRPKIPGRPPPAPPSGPFHPPVLEPGLSPAWVLVFVGLLFVVLGLSAWLLPPRSSAKAGSRSAPAVSYGMKEIEPGLYRVHMVEKGGRDYLVAYLVLTSVGDINESAIPDCMVTSRWNGDRYYGEFSGAGAFPRIDWGSDLPSSRTDLGTAPVVPGRAVTVHENEDARSGKKVFVVDSIHPVMKPG